MSRSSIENIYVSGSSADLERVGNWVQKLKASGLTVASTWLDVVLRTGAGNPRDAGNAARQVWAMVDLREVESADLVWFLVPSLAQPTRGAWLEVGFAHAFHRPLVFSGDTKQSIFCSLGEEFEADGNAFEWILERAREARS